MTLSNGTGIPSGRCIRSARDERSRQTAFESAGQAIGPKAYPGLSPNGSAYQSRTPKRGVQPFELRLDYLSKKLVLAGSGGMLTMLAESGSGTLAGGAHAETFRKKIATAEGRPKISGRSLNRDFDCPELIDAGLLTPGERPKAFFVLQRTEQTNVTEATDNIP